MRETRRLLAALALALLAVACSDRAVPENVTEITYEPIPPGYDFPTDPAKLLAAVATGDQAAMRRHAWNVWAGLTAGSGEFYLGEELPIWETWFTPNDLYSDDPIACVAPEAARPFRRTFEVPRQVGDFSSGQAASAVLGFNRYDLEVTHNVCAHSYNSSSVLDALNASFTTSTPIGAREIQNFAPTSVALKPVFALVKGSGLTTMSYWAGPDASTCPSEPQPSTWNRCVAIAAPGATMSPTAVVQCQYTADCDAANATPPGPLTTTTQTVPVLSIDHFYHFTLTADEVSQIQALLDGGGAFYTNGLTPEVGDQLVLVAMHVTTKEQSNWTWQTFWWTPFPDESPGGDFRTSNVKDEWRNYDMCTAYSMLETTGPSAGQPVVCFNPYLETNLGPQGRYSNCMTCHQMAAWPNFSTQYTFNGRISPDDPTLFDCNTKLDFLWSVTRAIPAQPPAQLCSGASSAERLLRQP
jgi:hypothetical protein